MRVIRQCRNHSLLFLGSALLDPALLGSINCLIPETSAVFLVPGLKVGETDRHLIPKISAKSDDLVPVTQPSVLSLAPKTSVSPDLVPHLDANDPNNCPCAGE